MLTDDKGGRHSSLSVLSIHLLEKTRNLTIGTRLSIFRSWPSAEVIAAQRDTNVFTHGTTEMIVLGSRLRSVPGGSPSTSSIPGRFNKKSMRPGVRQKQKKSFQVRRWRLDYISSLGHMARSTCRSRRVSIEIGKNREPRCSHM